MWTPWIVGGVLAAATGVAAIGGFYVMIAVSVWAARWLRPRWLSWVAGLATTLLILAVWIGIVAAIRGPACWRNVQACFADTAPAEDSPYAAEY